MKSFNILSMLLKFSVAIAWKSVKEVIKQPPPPKIIVPMSLMEIKTPQLIGILLGALVFFLTITAVFCLFYYSGSADRLRAELGADGQAAETCSSTGPAMNAPELHDYLIEASKSLPVRPQFSFILGMKVVLRTLKDGDRDGLLNACNGSAQFGESSYDPIRIFGWFANMDCSRLSSGGASHATVVSQLVDEFYYSNTATADGRGGGLGKRSAHIVLLEPVLRKPIGMVSLLANEPENLSIRLGNIWLTPFYQVIPAYDKKIRFSIFLLLN